MNAIALVILAALVIDVVVNLTADILNLKRLRSELPKAFAGWYDAPRYRRAQAYLRVNTLFGWLTALVDLAVLLLFWFGGGFAYLDGWVRGLALSPLVSGLIFIGTLVAAKAVLAQPFDAYATFGIEARFGFNQTTWRTYLLDRIKGIGLALLLGGPLLSAVLLFFQHAGPRAWWSGVMCKFGNRADPLMRSSGSGSCRIGASTRRMPPS
ncbi:MAG: hypothetical protein WAU91_05650 [Desulfatitalea sp.]